MSMIVAHNNMAVNSQRNLGTANVGLSKSMEKLSSGYRINVGADGPADLVISEQLRAQNAGLERALRNTSEAYNVTAIAEGAMNEMNNILKKMKQLALHAANSGITSPIQAAADQKEMDSAVQTINRIANTTKFSDQYLLNGTQSLQYSAATVVDTTIDNKLLNDTKTQLYQVDSLNRRLNISFSGTNGTIAEVAAGTASATGTSSAKKAYFEASNNGTNFAGADMDGTAITNDVAFKLTGSIGSKLYSFGKGETLGSIAQSINNDSSTTGIDATLIFDSSVTGKDTTAVTGTTTAAGTAVRATNAQVGWVMTKDFNAKADSTVEVTAAMTGAVLGMNTDADGAIYLKMTGATTYEAYKDADMTMKVGSGTTGAAGAFTATNNSGLAALKVTLGGTDVAAASDVIRLQIGTGLTVGGTDAEYAANNAVAGAGFIASDSTPGNALVDSILSGVRLGVNTDEAGQIFMKVTTGADGAAGNVSVKLYSDSSMDDKYLVAEGTNVGSLAAGGNVNVFAKTAEGGNSSTGLYGTINLSSVVTATAGAMEINSTYTSTIKAADLGIRISSADYGDDAKVEVEMTQGALFHDNSDPAGTQRLIDKSTADGSNKSAGQSASVSINGQSYKVSSEFGVNIASNDANADLVFNEGELGKTTIAVQGYVDGAFASRAGELANLNNYSTQNINSTQESVRDLKDGMQLQLGEGYNTYERTVISIRNMNIENLGLTTFTDDWEGNGMTSTKTLSLADLQGGRLADLATDPLKALQIIEQAINDVSNTRAQIGAVQSNMLQTNMNNLSVAIENIQKTESGIRDTDMATEMTEFTKNQVLQNASMSMLAQANAQSQAALQLLG